MTYEITYDYCSEEGFEERNVLEYFEGSWSDMVDYIMDLKKCGCYHIQSAAINDLESEVQ